MRAQTSWLALPFVLLATGAVAQSAPPQPQQLERIEEVDNPVTVSAKPSTQTRIVEKREGGRVTEAKVKSGGSTYTVKPNTPAGSALPGDAAGSANRGPQWTVLEFDLLAKKKKRSAEEADKEDGPPPPPPAQPAASTK
ncbi:MULTISPECIES: hypothetical protein [unclassified Duganella]|uniref:hypothetical protein n=1 Tax=unclassified Duganella TaxID=2636909 RepID=UPI0006F5E6F4|nr:MULTISPECIES: hypothetical protein [unclassified Duganella]KQV51043.1 hypothetical protein ASD07_08985 [Duganella sp. Root336D2]KQZ40007.1 hypothetical protein ASD58_06400 [Duganella sp. Root1480D1]KRC00624.1 hypothetical protein ASE26_23195 [Duganella sp. Root198D2]